MAQENIQRLQAKHSIYTREARVGLDVSIHFREVVLEQYFERTHRLSKQSRTNCQKQTRVLQITRFLLCSSLSGVQVLSMGSTGNFCSNLVSFKTDMKISTRATYIGIARDFFYSASLLISIPGGKSLILTQLCFLSYLCFFPFLFFLKFLISVSVPLVL